MSLINGAVLEKKILEVLKTELKGVEEKNNHILLYLHRIEERLNALETVAWDIEHECEKCGKKFEMNDIDMVDGTWLCRLCEEEAK